MFSIVNYVTIPRARLSDLKNVANKMGSMLGATDETVSCRTYLKENKRQQSDITKFSQVCVRRFESSGM